MLLTFAEETITVKVPEGDDNDALTESIEETWLDEAIAEAMREARDKIQTALIDRKVSGAKVYWT